MSGVEQQHLRPAQSSRSLSVPQAVPAEVTALPLGHCAGQLSNNQICATLGTWGIFQPMQRSPIAQPPRQHQQV